MNTINYLDHVLYKPDITHRRYDIDIGKKENEEGIVKRVAVAVLPFLALYGPLGTALSAVMNSSRAYSHLTEANQAHMEGNSREMTLQLGKMALALLALTLIVHKFTLGLWITTGVDFLQSEMNTAHHLCEREYAKALEELLQAFGSAFYLAFMLTGHLELMLIFAIVQTILSLYQARGEFSKGRYIEGFAKFALASVRAYQAKGYQEAIRARDELLKKQNMFAIYQKLIKAKQASHLLFHPLSSLDKEEVTLKDAKGNEYQFGSHFHGLGKTLVKGENLAIRTKWIDGKEMTEIDFKVNHAFRSQIDQSLSFLKNLHPKDWKEISKITGSHIESFSFGKGDFFKEEALLFNPGLAEKIEMKGLGTILIGSQGYVPNLYDRVVIRMESGKNLFQLHEMLCLMDLDQAICLSSAEDLERLKMGHLFRTFFPKEAFSFERSKEFFKLPLDELSKKITKIAPDMKMIFDQYLAKMVAEPLFDGRIRYRIVGLADEIRAQGGVALTAALTGAQSQKDLFERTASILKMGMLSLETRDTNGINKHGWGGIEYFSGGADSVYTQMITEHHTKNSRPFSDFKYQSSIRFLISLEALELGSYQYHQDEAGTRDESFWGLNPYSKRENILEFTKNENNHFNFDHELMLKERIAPSFIQGIIVPNQTVKDDLLRYLKECGLLNINIHVAKNITEEIF